MLSPALCDLEITSLGFLQCDNAAIAPFKMEP